jgi:hypothetical protein
MTIARKRRTREHVIADLSVNFVERQVLLSGHTAERTRHDYGYDLMLTTYDTNGEPESGEVRLQIKATDSLPVLKGNGKVSWRIERSDLARWMNDPFPVILAVYDAQTETAYWLYVQRHFQAQSNFSLFTAGRTVTVHIPVTNVLDLAAIRQFAQFRDAVNRQYRGGVDYNA